MATQTNNARRASSTSLTSLHGRPSLGALLIAALVVLLALPASASATEPPPDHGSAEALGTFIDEVMDDHFDSYGLAGATVTVVQDGQVLVSKGYGHADIASEAPVMADSTLFPTASVAKLFTWTAVMQLVEDGKLDLHADVNTYLRSFQVPPTFEEPVRLWHLLSHTAGFEDRPVVGAFSLSSHDLPDLETALIRFLPARAWEPGAYTAYSNYSTALAAHIVAEVSGMAWEDYLEAHIFEPLGMTHTSADQPIPARLAPSVTHVYARDEGGLVESDWEFSVLAPAGGIVSTSADMGRFMRAQLGGGQLDGQRILDEATAQQMHDQLFTHDERLEGNAHGLWESEERGERILSHPGDLNTAHTLLALAPEHDLGLYVAYNSVGGPEARADFSEAFWQFLFPGQVPTPAEETGTPSSASAERFAGSYANNRISTTTLARLLALFGGLSVSADGEDLLTEGFLEPQRWTPLGDNEFAQVGGPARMVFGEDDDGVTDLVFGGSSLTPYSPLTAYAPASWLDSPTLHGGLLLVAVLLTLSALLVWPISGFVKRRRGGHDAGGARFARWWAAATGGLFLLFIVLLVVSLSDLAAIEYGLPPLLVITLSVGVVASVLTIGVVIHAILAWRRGYWRLAGRVQHSLIALAYLALVWQLDHWNLLGFRV